jgi:hypothetical protein
MTALRAALFAAALGFASWSGALISPALAQGGPAGFEVTTHDADILEIRFHNMPLKGVHADAAQNALALDFVSGVDGAAFDRLSTSLPDWISLAYANYDSGVIRASRPVTFLTRNESDGFSLRLVASAPAAMVQAPLGPVALRGYVDDGGDPPPRQPIAALMPGDPPPPLGNAFARYDSYGAMRGYAELELAVGRANPFWESAYAQAAIQSDSAIALGTEYHSYHGGDTVIASHAPVKITLADGVSIIGSLDDTDAGADNVRQANGSFATNSHINLFSGALGFGLALNPDTLFTLEALEGNDITGGRVTGFAGSPDSFWQLDGAYHKPDMDTPQTIAARAFTDQVVLGTSQHIGYGIWASLDGRAVNYGIHGDSSVARTAGWDANLRWAADLGPLLAGISYDGHGEYLVDNEIFSGAAPTPYVPLSLRTMETHAVTASLSSLLWGDTLWLDLYGGYVDDRYAKGGGIYGGALRYRPAPGVDIALGARHSNVSLIEGETGAETSAGLSFTLRFDGPSNYF